jgi:hypothetical protein
MPVARYFLWVGAVLLAVLFIVDACLPTLPFRRSAGAPTVTIRIYSEQKSPGPIVLDTSAPLTRVAIAADPLPPAPLPPASDAVPDRARQALAQLQTVDVPPPQPTRAKKPAVHHQHKMARQYAAPQPFRIANQSQYAWFGGRMWW